MSPKNRLHLRENFAFLLDGCKKYEPTVFVLFALFTVCSALLPFVSVLLPKVLVAGLEQKWALSRILLGAGMLGAAGMALGGGQAWAQAMFSVRVISVRLTRQERSVHLAVHNKGDAFDDDAIAHLFERFYRLDQSRTRQTGGYGLGLAIADSICQRHQGHISAANEDEGVTFHVTLPVAQRERGRQHWK